MRGYSWLRFADQPVAIILIAASAASVVGCSSSCPTGRVKSESGTCVAAEVVDFAACVRSAGAAVIDQESARQISASAYGASGSAQWQDRVRADFAGPATEHQRVVIDECIARTRAKEPPVDSAAFPGRWVAVLQDGTQKHLEIAPDQRFRAAEVTRTARCEYVGVLRIEGRAITRTITGADPACGYVPIGHSERFDILHVAPEQFTLRTAIGEVTYARAR